MLSIDCHAPPTSPTPPAARATPVLSLPRVAVTFGTESRRAPSARRDRRGDTAQVNIPVYSCITFRHGNVCVR
ncbi:MAG: hypothetical protein JXP73_10870 [Deltaproteobacteria bacterium]|nr:hypothetical protein [Deltaproteobacteria bacterium]